MGLIRAQPVAQLAQAVDLPPFDRTDQWDTLQTVKLRANKSVWEYAQDFSEHAGQEYASITGICS